MRAKKTTNIYEELRAIQILKALQIAIINLKNIQDK